MGITEGRNEEQEVRTVGRQHCAGSGNDGRLKDEYEIITVACRTVQAVATAAGRNREHESEGSGMQNCTDSGDGGRQN
jgi:hypothetical protein